MSDATPSEAQESPKATLSQFIEKNSKLITALGVFIALFGFSTKIDDEGLKFVLPALFLGGAVLIALELMWNLPPEPWHWRLYWFQLVASLIAVYLSWYWLSTFKNLWIPLVAFVVFSVVAMLIVSAVDWLLGKVLARLQFVEGLRAKRRYVRIRFLVVFTLLMAAVIIASRVWRLH